MPLQRKLHSVYRSTDAFIEIQLHEDGLPVGSDGVLSCNLTFRRPGSEDVTISSDVQPSWFELQYPAVYRDRAINVIRVNLKDVPDPPGDGRWDCHVTIFDALSSGGFHCGSFKVDLKSLLQGIEVIGFLGDQDSNLGTTRQLELNFDSFSGQNRGVFLYAATTNGNTLSDLDSAVYEIEEDGNIIATGSLLPSDQITFVEVTANCVRALIPIGDATTGDVIVRVTYTWTTTGGSTPRQLSIQALAMRNVSQADLAAPFDEDEAYSAGAGAGGDPVSVTPSGAGDLVLTLAMLGNPSTSPAVLDPEGYTDGTPQAAGSFDFNMSYRIVDDATQQDIDWTSPHASGGWLLYAAVIRPA